MASLSTNIPTSARSVAKMSSFVLQNTSRQDVALHGSTDEFDYIITSDGHGQGSRKHALRDLFKFLDWSSILQNENWYKNNVDENGSYISPLFTELHSNTTAFSEDTATCQGCTLSVVLIYPNRFECFTIGDSTIKIWEKSDTWQRTFVSVDHDINFEEDNAQLEARERNDALFCRRHWEHQSIVVKNGIRTKDINRLKALDATKMTMEESAYVYFDDGSLLNMTRALGHYPTASVIENAKEAGHVLSCTEHSLTKVVVERKTDVKYAIINATDGVWDVTAGDVEKTFLDSIAEDDAAEKCVRKVKQLWSQQWEYWYSGVNTGNTRLPDWNHDDIGCSVAYC
jgi:serine/threonine protein phosphatase PrpC